MNKKNLLSILMLIVALSMIVASCGTAAEPTAVVQEPTTVAEEPTAVAEEPTTVVEEPTAVAEEPTAAPEEPAAKKVLRVGYHQEPDTLNPFTSQMTGEVTLSMIEGLVMSNNENTYIPVLAKEIPTFDNGGIVTNDDGTLDMTWHLQEGVKWHDGVEFTSADVCFTYDWLMTDGAAMVYNQLEYTEHILACDAPDPYTVVFHWKDTYAPYVTLFDAILPKHILEGQDVATYDAYNRSPIGTGPFKFVEWKAGEYVRVERNDDYWRGPEYPYLDEVIYYIVPDVNTRLNGLKAGEYDIAEIDTTQVGEMEGVPGYRVEMVNRNIWINFATAINSDRTKKLFGDKTVRQALAYAIDKESIVNDLLEGTVEVAYTPILPNSPYHNPNVNHYDFDLEKAAQMLDEAGWVVGDDGIRVKDGERFSFTFMARASRAQRTAIAQVIQALYKEIGIEVDIETKEDSAWIESWVAGDWDAIIGGWILPADPSITGLYACGASNNMTGHCNPELDEVMRASDTELDMEKRKELMFQAQEMLLDEAVEIPIHYMTTPFVLNAKFEGFKGSGTNLGSFWNMYEWNLAD